MSKSKKKTKSKTGMESTYDNKKEEVVAAEVPTEVETPPPTMSVELTAFQAIMDAKAAVELLDRHHFNGKINVMLDRALAFLDEREKLIKKNAPAV